MAFYDSENKTLRVTCAKCGEQIDVEVRAEVEINSYITIEEK